MPLYEMNATQDTRFVRTLRVKNLLSFGDDSEVISLEPLNVLIGPNASGKSNLLEVMGVLRAAALGGFSGLFREGGGIDEWLWKGGKDHPTAEVEVTVSYPDSTIPLRHRLAFTSVGQRTELIDEVVENEMPNRPGQANPYFFYRYQNGHPVLNVRESVEAPPGTELSRMERRLERQDLTPDQSVLWQRKDPHQYPEITFLGQQYSRISMYREWNLGRNTAPRRPQQVDLPTDFLSEDASNLALVLNSLWNRYGARASLLRQLQVFSDSVLDLTPSLEGGTVQLYAHEQGLARPVPATRLSDGTMRYLCLLAVLCHPAPPPVVCIEEPEIGMHPDILPTIAALLLDASTRTQLFVTTHSDVLVDALSKRPETVIVCEKSGGVTNLRRLDRRSLASWLERYTLGDLWRRGELGGNRW